MATFPKILIAAPTSSAKRYCFEDWLDNALLTNYPGEWKIVLFDNTMDNGESAERQNKYYKDKYNGDKFECLRTDTRFLQHSLIARICKSHNDVRQYALDHNYEYLFHLESDVLPKPHFLQELLLHKKPVVGALYYRDEGRFRRLMIQQKVYRAPNNIFSKNFDPTDDLYFIDGTLKQASHIGLGAVLIRKDVLQKIPFRHVQNLHVHTDSYFAEDCHRHKIKILCDTNLICEHRNQNWITEVYTDKNKA